MDSKAFLEAVRQMRAAQREYFARRKQGYNAPEAFARAKSLEKAVDIAIQEHDSGQRKLFGQEARQ